MTAVSPTLHEVTPPGDGLRAIAATDDGALWCVLGSVGAVVRRAPDGSLARHDLDSAARPHSVAAATADSVWVTDRGADRILRLDASGVVWSASVPTRHSAPAGIVGLDDGSAWFLEEHADAVGRVDILGRVAEFATGVPGGAPASIASDGSSVWFSLPGAGAIAHARGGDSLPGLVRFDDPLAAPTAVSMGGDGCLWFADPARGLLGRIGRGGAVVEFAVGDDVSRPIGVAADAAGGCWFITDGSGSIGRIDAAGHSSYAAVPAEHGAPVAIAVTSTGEAWAVLESGSLLRIPDPGSLAADIQ